MKRTGEAYAAPPEQGTECSRRDLLRLGPPNRRVCIKSLTRSNRRNLPHATWDRWCVYCWGVNWIDWALSCVRQSVHVKSPDASTTQQFGGTPHLFKKEGSNLHAIFIVGQHYAVADHLFPPAYMHMIALYTVW